MAKQDKSDWISVDVDDCESVMDLVRRLTEAHAEMLAKGGRECEESVTIDHDEVSVRYLRPETPEETKKRVADDKRMRDARKQFAEGKKASSLAQMRRQAKQFGYKLVKDES